MWLTAWEWKGMWKSVNSRSSLDLHQRFHNLFKILNTSIWSCISNLWRSSHYQHNLDLVNKDDYIWYFVNVNTPVPSVNYCDGLDRCILYCILFVFMLALLRFCVVTEFSVNKDLYLQYSSAFQSRYKGHIDCIFSTNALLLSPSHAGGVCSFVSGITQKRVRYVFSFISEGS